MIHDLFSAPYILDIETTQIRDHGRDDEKFLEYKTLVLSSLIFMSQGL